MQFFDQTTSAKPESPVSKYVKYKSSTKEWTYFDKDKSKNVKVDMSKGFVVFDTTFSCTGFDGDWAYYSNEIRNFRKERMVFKRSKGKGEDRKSETLTEGYYVSDAVFDVMKKSGEADITDKAIKTEVKTNNGNYTVNVYGVFIDSPSELVKLQLVKGAAKGKGEFKDGKWIPQGGGYNQLKFSPSSQYIVVKDYIEEIFKATKLPYYVPVFESAEIDSDASYVEHAVESAHTLNAYFKELKAYNNSFNSNEESIDSDEEADTAADVFAEEEPATKASDLPF